MIKSMALENFMNLQAISIKEIGKRERSMAMVHKLLMVKKERVNGDRVN